MITPETVKLADRLPEVEKKLVEARGKSAKARADEEKRHVEALDRLQAEDGELAAEHSKCARSKKAIFDSIPRELTGPADRAGSAYRDAAGKIKYERDQRAIAAELLDDYEGPKEGRIPLAEQLEAADAALQAAEKKLSELKAEQVKAEKAVEAAYQKVRREALAKADAARA